MRASDIAAIQREFDWLQGAWPGVTWERESEGRYTGKRGSTGETMVVSLRAPVDDGYEPDADEEWEPRYENRVEFSISITFHRTDPDRPEWSAQHLLKEALLRCANWEPR